MTTNACKRCQGETRPHTITYADGEAYSLRRPIVTMRLNPRRNRRAQRTASR